MLNKYLTCNIIRWHCKLSARDESYDSCPRRWSEHTNQREATLSWLDDWVPFCRELRWLILYCAPKKGKQKASIIYFSYLTFYFNYLLFDPYTLHEIF